LFERVEVLDYCEPKQLVDTGPSFIALMHARAPRRMKMVETRRVRAEVVVSLAVA
jgi:hypothetical protein